MFTSRLYFPTVALLSIPLCSPGSHCIRCVCVCVAAYGCMCVEGFQRCAGFFVAPVTRLSRSFMMRLPVSKAITPLSNPTEKLEKMGSSLTDGKQHTHTQKNKKQNRKQNLFSRTPLYLIPLRLSQIKKHEHKQKRREVFV